MTRLHFYVYDQVSDQDSADPYLLQLIRQLRPISGSKFIINSAWLKDPADP